MQLPLVVAPPANVPKPLPFAPGMFPPLAGVGGEAPIVNPFFGVGNPNRYGNGASNGLNDSSDAIAFANAAPGNTITFSAGTYLVQKDTTITANVVWAYGALLKPANGITITVSGAIPASLYQFFDVSLGGRIRIIRGAAPFINVEWFGASTSRTSVDNDPGIQNSILCSLDMADLTSVSSGCAIPVSLSGRYEITRIYLPNFHEIYGTSSQCGFNPQANQTGVVLGRNLAETATTIQGILYNVTISCRSNLALQHGVEAGLATGVVLSQLEWTNVSIKNAGGEGIRVIGVFASSGIVGWSHTNTYIYNAQSNCVHLKVGVLNVLQDTSGIYTDCGDGWFVEDIGSGTTASEAITFRSTRFESLGQPASTGIQKVGGKGFLSTIFNGQYSFDSCYFEGNGNRAGDTTGAHIDITAPLSLMVDGAGVMASTNNLVIIRKGGNAIIQGQFIAPGPNRSGLFVSDTPSGGSDIGTFINGLNRWDTSYTQAQLFQSLNGATTRFVGFCGPTTNYLEVRARQRAIVLRDQSTPAVDNGAISYLGVRRLANNAGGSTTIANNAIATFMQSGVTAMVLITEYGLSRCALVLISGGGLATLVAQKSAATDFTITSGTAGKLNIYLDGGTNTWVVQNLTGAGVLLSATQIGGEPMENIDNGIFYEGKFQT